MTIQLTWDEDTPKTGLPDEGTDTKQYEPTPGQDGHVEITPEPVGSGPVVETDFTLPLIITATPATPDPGDSISVTGSGLAASSSGTLELVSGPPGTDGEVIASVPVTANASGEVTGTVTVPAETEPGTYHLVLSGAPTASGGRVVIDNTTITVGGTPTEPVIEADKTTVDASGDETERTVTVTGSGFPASTAGRVSINTGAPGTGGTEVVGADVTTGADGTIAATPLIVPVDQAEGDYHIHAEYTGAVTDDLPLTITAGPVGPTLEIDPDTIDSSAPDAADRTVTATGTGFPASTAGTVAIHPGAPGSGGTAIVTENVTTDATGAIPETPLEVPLDQEAGDYHVVATVGAATADDTPLTVTAGPAATVESDVTEVEAGGTINVTGTGFPVSTAGTVGLYDSEDTEIVSAPVTTTATGDIESTPLTVPAETEPGDYELRAEVDTVTAVGADPITVTAAPAPEPPTGLVLSDVGPASMAATWDAVDGATGYVVYYKPTAETPWMVAGEVTAPTVTATVTNLTSETSYDIAVATLVDTEVSERSAAETEVTAAGGAPLDQAEAAAGTPTTTSVPLTWDPVADAQSYQIRWRVATDADWAPTYGTEDGVATGTSMEGLEPGTDYLFGVRAIGDGTTNTSGPWSADVAASTDAALARKAAARKTAKRTTKKK